RALIGLSALRWLGADFTDALEHAEEARRAAEALGDDFTLTQAWNVVGRAHIAFGTFATAERAWRQALTYADRGGYVGEKAEIIAWLLISAFYGPMPADEGIELCKEFHDSSDDATIRAWCCVERAPLEAMQGRFELARELLATGSRALRELGLNIYAANTAQEAFVVEMLAGDATAAARTLRAGYEALEQMGERGFLSTIAGMLAHVLCALGEYNEAEQFSRAAESLAAPDDALSQLLWRSGRAKVCAHRG